MKQGFLLSQRGRGTAEIPRNTRVRVVFLEAGGRVAASNRKIYDPAPGFQTFYFWEPSRQGRVHTDRTAGGDRHHRHFGRPAAASLDQVEKQGERAQMPEQPPPGDAWLAALRG